MTEIGSLMGHKRQKQQEILSNFMGIRIMLSSFVFHGKLAKMFSAISLHYSFSRIIIFLSNLKACKNSKGSNHHLSIQFNSYDIINDMFDKLRRLSRVIYGSLCPVSLYQDFYRYVITPCLFVLFSHAAIPSL
jgi:hypothetical protein